MLFGYFFPFLQEYWCTHLCTVSTHAHTHTHHSHTLTHTHSYTYPGLILSKSSMKSLASCDTSSKTSSSKLTGYSPFHGDIEEESLGVCLLGMESSPSAWKRRFLNNEVWEDAWASMCECVMCWVIKWVCVCVWACVLTVHRWVHQWLL